MTLTAIKYNSASSTLSLLDQRLLPTQTKYLEYRTAEEVAAAIKAMVVRGAPAIGITAGYGLAMAWKAGQDIRQAGVIVEYSKGGFGGSFRGLKLCIQGSESPSQEVTKNKI